MADKLEHDPLFTGDKIQLKLQKALLTLPPQQRLVFNMKYFENMKYEEISEILDLPLGTVKAQLFRARWAGQRALEAVADALGGIGGGHFGHSRAELLRALEEDRVVEQRERLWGDRGPAAARAIGFHDGLVVQVQQRQRPVAQQGEDPGHGLAFCRSGPDGLLRQVKCNARGGDGAVSRRRPGPGA